MTSQVNTKGSQTSQDQSHKRQASKVPDPENSFHQQSNRTWGTSQRINLQPSTRLPKIVPPTQLIQGTPPSPSRKPTHHKGTATHHPQRHTCPHRHTHPHTHFRTKCLTQAAQFHSVQQAKHKRVNYFKHHAGPRHQGITSRGTRPQSANQDHKTCNPTQFHCGEDQATQGGSAAARKRFSQGPGGEETLLATPDHDPQFEITSQSMAEQVIC